MKTVPIVFLCLILPVSLAAIGHAELADPIRLLENDLPHAAPVLGDIDGDGLQDLVVGVYRDDPYTGARVQWFRNNGTNRSPRYGQGQWLQADGKDVAMDEFCYTGAGPQLVDFDGDGTTDLVAAERECRFTVFRGRADQSFGAPVTYRYGDEKSLLGQCRHNGRLFLFDWDHDDDQDLLVTGVTKVWIVPNAGSTSEPKFGDPIELLSQPSGEERFASCVAVDWDVDGKCDVVCGRWDGSVLWYRNESIVAENAALSPQHLGEARVLVGPGLSWMVEADKHGNVANSNQPKGQIRVSVADYDSDGDLDLIVGDGWRSQIPRDQRVKLDEDEISMRNQARVKERELRRKIEQLTKAPSDETDAQRLTRIHQIELLTSECATAWQRANAQCHFL